MVAVTVTVPLFCARVRSSAPGDVSDSPDASDASVASGAGTASWVTAMSPAVHFTRSAPAVDPRIFGVTMIVLRPSQVAGA